MKIRHLVAGASASLLATAMISTQADAADPVDTLPSDSAQSWLLDQLDAGLLPSSYGGASYGTSADAVISLAEAGDASDAIAIANALAGQIGSYVTGEAWGDAGSFYAGSGAKAIVALQSAGLDPTEVGPSDLDLVDELEDAVQPSGRIQDTSAWGDYANTFGQAFAARALTEAGSPAADDVTSFLISQQCSPGWFRLYFNGADTSCDASATGGPSVDSTALAVMALAPSVEAGTATAATARAVGRAESWLLSVQGTDGGWADGTTDGTANANSTGLAGRAMIATGHPAAAKKAAVWVRSHQIQNVGSCETYADADLGAIGFDTAAWTAAQADGVGTANDQFIIATAQALPILDVLPTADSAPAIAGPSGYVAAGSNVTYTVTGLAAGRPACVSLGATNTLVAADVDGTATVSFTVPAGASTVSVEDEAGTDATTTTTALGRTKLTVAAPATTKIGKTVTVRVTGLAAGEKTTVTMGSRKVATGVANNAGAFTAKVTVKGPKGKTTVVAVGQFANRKGAVKVTVQAK